MRHLILLTLVLPVVALAANPKATALAKEADRFYKDGKYKEAADALQKAYAIEPNPTLLYNEARALDQAGDLKGSLAAYREFVGIDGADAALVKKANLAMDRLRSLVAKLDADEQLRIADKKRADEEAQKEKDRAAAELAEANKEKAALEAKQEKELSAAAKTYNLRKSLAFVTAGVTIASLGTGIVLGITSNGAKTNFTNATNVADKDKFMKDTRGLALGADICYAGAIVFAAATVIIFPKYSDPSIEKKVDVAIAPIPGGMSASFGAKF